MIRTVCTTISALILLGAAGTAAGMAAPHRPEVAEAAEAVKPAGGEPAHFYYYYKQQKALTLDTSEIAIYQAKPRAMADALVAAGLDAAKATVRATPGWTMVPLPADATEAQIRAIIAQLAADPAIDFATPVFYGEQSSEVMITSDILVSVNDPANPGAAADGTIGEVLEADYASMPGTYRLRSASKDGFVTLAMVNAIALDPAFRYAEPNVLCTGTANAIPNDIIFQIQWGLHNTGQSGGTNDFDMDVPEAWDITSGNSGVVVVVMDDGVQLDHPDLNLRLPGIDTTGGAGGGAPGNACDNHGTAVAGCISALMNNSIGVAGVAPNCRTAPARAYISQLSCNGNIDIEPEWIVNALQWADDINARVTNLSAGFGFFSAAIVDKYAATRETGMVHFVASGNHGMEFIGFPANVPSVMAVGAVNRNGGRASFSAYGAALAFCAPGQEIATTDRTGGDGYASAGDFPDYANLSGTSFASPYAAGVAALLISQNGALTPSEIENRMKNSCVNIGPAGFDNETGHGILSAGGALSDGYPFNDHCADAISVSAGGTYFGTLIGAGDDGNSSCGGAASNPDVWYRFTATGCGTQLRLSTCGTHDQGGQDTGIDTVLTVFNGCNGTELACNDDAVVCFGGEDNGAHRDSHVSLNVAGGQTVLIRVSKFGGTAVGGFRLNVAFGPANDDCNAAAPVGLGSTSICNDYARTDGPAEPEDCNFFSNPGILADVWFFHQATCNGTVTVQTCGNSFDTELAIYSDICPTTPGSVITCNDDITGPAGCGQPTRSLVTFPALSGHVYLIRVGGYGGATGSATLNVSCTPFPACSCDWNDSFSLDSSDFFAFLTDFFASNADYNHSGGTDSSDFFDFLACFLGGCP